MDNKLKSTIGIVAVLVIGIAVTQWFFGQQRPSINSSSTQPEVTDFPAPHFENTELGIGFDHSTELSEVVEATVSGESGTRWSANFHNIPNLQVSATTSDFAPTEWMGNPWWINAKLDSEENEDVVLQKIKKEMPLALKVEKVTNDKNVSGFKVYALNCIGFCQLERFFVIPLENADYNNLVITGVLKVMKSPTLAPQAVATLGARVAMDVPADYKKNLVESAPDEIAKIENGDAETDTLNVIRWQQEIFDSLELTK